MQRLIAQLTQVNETCSQSLCSAYKAMLLYYNELSNSVTLSDRKILEFADLQRTISGITIVLDNIDNQSLALSLDMLKKVLDERWYRLQRYQDNIYAADDSAHTQFCLALARTLHTELPNQYQCIPQLLMPSLFMMDKLNEMSFNTFVVDDTMSHPLSLSLLLSYCHQIIQGHRPATIQILNPYTKMPLSKTELDRLINSTKECTWLYQATLHYRKLLSQRDGATVQSILEQLAQGLRQGRDRANLRESEASINAYNAIINFGTFFDQISPCSQAILLSLKGKDSTFQSVWESLSHKGEVCVAEMADAIDTIIHHRDNQKYFSNIDEIALEEAEYNYQQYLKRFNECLCTSSFMWNRNFRINRHDHRIEFIKLFQDTSFMMQFMSSPAIKNFMKKIINDADIMKEMIQSNPEKWIMILKTSGFTATDIQKSLITMMRDIPFDEAFIKTMFSLECTLSTLYQYAKNQSRTDILNLLLRIEPDCNKWLIALRNNNEPELVIANIMIKLIQNDENQEAYCQTVLTQGVSVSAMLWSAIETKNISMIKLIIRLKPDALITPYKGNNNYVGPIMHACLSTKNILALQTLISADAQYSQVDSQGETLLTYAIKNHSNVNEIIAMCPALINQPNTALQTPLSIAVENNNRDQVEKLLAANCDLNQPNKEGLTPLDLACTRKHSRIARWLIEKEAKGDMNQIAVKYIHEFIKFGGSKDNVVKALLKRSIDLTQCDEEGNTPLMTAVCCGSAEIVKCLLAAAPQAMHIRNKEGQLPREKAKRLDILTAITKVELNIKNKEKLASQRDSSVVTNSVFNNGTNVSNQKEIPNNKNLNVLNHS